MGTPADLAMNCPEAFRLALISSAGFASALTLTLLASASDRVTSKCGFAHYLARLFVASLTVGIVSLIGVYASEYLGGMGKLNWLFLIALSVAVTLVHFPARKFFFLVLPVTFFGFFGLPAVAIVTGIPLD